MEDSLSNRTKVESDVPDSIRPYLNEISERLWAGRAAVMIGAGFSKNAGNGFPDWNQLGDLFHEKAHGIKSDTEKPKYLNVLRLAEEVQAAIGRPALENLLRSNIPDLNIEPSPLHVDLLELPWVDVFTTNYDTLLERASAKVVTRRYEPVINKEDIPYAIKPRIVKLHGSFPSERPFIITEEDYRRYPHDHAPFVNTVQQALLENTFCLIGFSGDDPNFLQWIGWIRDNLGKDKTQKIYLIGVFNLSSARLQLLAQREIIVIDFSCCHGIEKNDHRKALSWFFEYMKSKKKNILNWPSSRKIAPPACDANYIEEIKNITNEWRQDRQAYPGWLILPHDNRESLWYHTSKWIHRLPDAEKQPPGVDIQYIFELIWRLERCLIPVPENIANLCEKILQKYWPFKTTNPPENCQIHLGDGKFKNLPWDTIREAWMAIALAMLRFYREEGHLNKWKEAESQLKALAEYLTGAQSEFLNYEGFNFSLFSLDLPSAKQRLNDWRPNDTQPYWMVKRAAGLAEIGLLGEAELIARNALECIRKKLNQKADASDLSLVSLESNVMLIWKYIRDAAALKNGEFGVLQNERIQFNDRWNELKGFKCDPWNEIKLFELSLRNPPVQRKIITKKREFDIGQVSQIRHFNGGDQDALNAYAFLRFCEEVGLPYRIGSYAIANETAAASLRHISRYSPFWAFATLARLGDEKATASLFSRESICKFTINEANQLTNSYLSALKKCQDEIHNGDAFQDITYGVRLAQLLPEVISRLCCKCSKATRRIVLEFLTELYSSPNKTKYKNVKNITRRLMSSMSKLEKYELIPCLLKIPFPEGLNNISKNEFPNPFIFLNLDQKPKCAPILEIQFEIVDHLIQQASLDNSSRRDWAITSLMTLHELKLLNDDQEKNLGKSIWHKTDKFGLPSGTNFYKFNFLTLPHPDFINPNPLFKEYIGATPLPLQKKEESVTMSGADIPVVHEIICASSNNESIWTEEDVAGILKNLLAWWDADKDRLRGNENTPTLFPSIPEEFRARFSCIIKLLVNVIGPKLKLDSSDSVKNSLERLLNEMRWNQLQVLEAEAACLHLFPSRKADFCNQISEALTSSQDDIRRDGVMAIARILINNSEIKEDSLEATAEEMLCQYLTWCPTHSISTALLAIVIVLKNAPKRFSAKIETATLRRLTTLLIETKYDNGNLYLDFDERLEIRRISSILASELWLYYKSRKSSTPGVVEKWRESCLTPDEFSEIRNAWEDCESI